jgi:hypothetical protein
MCYTRAFLIDGVKRTELIEQDPRSEEVIEPLVRGKHLRRYHIQEANQWMLYLPHGADIEAYPAVEDHLSKYKEGLESRATDQRWYELQQPQEEYVEYFDGPKILYPEIAPEVRFVLDSGPLYPNNKCFFLPTERQELVALLNSKLCEFYLTQVLAKLEGTTGDDVYYEFRRQYLKEFPVSLPENDLKGSKIESLTDFAKKMGSLRADRASLNLNLLDYLGNYSEERSLAEIGFTQPPESAADSVLQQTAEQKPNLRVGAATVHRESDTTVEIRLTARYKPDDEEGYDTDQWGYTETEPLPALRITDLDPIEADLIEAFVPVAVDKSDGFAGFRENATKTNSLVDRVRKLTLPKVADVRDGLESYQETKAQAEELEEEIEETDALIDEIVYELYGLSEEEIEIVEDAVGE